MQTTIKNGFDMLVEAIEIDARNASKMPLFNILKAEWSKGLLMMAMTMHEITGTPMLIDKEDEDPSWEPLKAGTALLIDYKKRSGIKVYSGALYCAYDHRSDTIVTPALKRFTGPTAFYASALHELIHSTGHKTRFNRESLYRPTDEGGDASPFYAEEELVAILGTIFLGHSIGLPDEEVAALCLPMLHKYYKQLGFDHAIFKRAAHAADDAAHYILNREKINREAKVDVISESIAG